jgi:hypothetical protein
VKGKPAKQFEKVHGFQPTPRSEERMQQAIENEQRSREGGEDFFLLIISVVVVE